MQAAKASRLTSHIQLLYSQKGIPSFPKSPFGLISEKLRCSGSLPPSSVLWKPYTHSINKPLTPLLPSLQSGAQSLELPPQPLPGQETVWPVSELYTGPQTCRAGCFSHSWYITSSPPYATYERTLNTFENNLVLTIKLSKF